MIINYCRIAKKTEIVAVYHNGVRTKRPLQQNPLVRLNPVQSKLLLLKCECRDRERQINSSQCILYTVRHTKNHGVGTVN